MRSPIIGCASEKPGKGTQGGRRDKDPCRAPAGRGSGERSQRLPNRESDGRRSVDAQQVHQRRARECPHRCRGSSLSVLLPASSPEGPPASETLRSFGVACRVRVDAGEHNHAAAGAVVRRRAEDDGRERSDGDPLIPHGCWADRFFHFTNQNPGNGMSASRQKVRVSFQVRRRVKQRPDLRKNNRNGSNPSAKQKQLGRQKC